MNWEVPGASICDIGHAELPPVYASVYLQYTYIPILPNSVGGYTSLGGHAAVSAGGFAFGFRRAVHMLRRYVNA